MGYKDNLINTVLEEKGLGHFSGCTGFGCGAAFNFLAVLPDGETHACRKFPSEVGNLKEKSLRDIYDGEKADKYRRGTAACRECKLNPICGGCLAAVFSSGRELFKEADPYCQRARS